MLNEIAKTTAITKLPGGFGRLPTTYKTPQQLVESLDLIDEVQANCIAACDYKRGEELSKAKQQLPHGSFLQALEAKGMPSRDARRFMDWFKSAKFAHLDTAKAEQKLSRGARSEFCRADADTQAVIAVAVSDDETPKITAKQIKSVSAAPIEVKQQVQAIAGEGYNDRVIEKVRLLINHDEYEIDTSSLTDEEKDDCLLEQNTRIEALTFQVSANDLALQVGMKKYGYYDSEGLWWESKPFTIIKNLLPELSASEKRELINSLTTTIDV